MAWIESHEELLDHPKSKRLKRKLRASEHEVVGILHYFWHWAVKFAEDGCISQFTAEDIADAIRYEGDAELLLRSLIESGFVDEVDGKLHIHDWFEYAGKLILWRRKEAERLRKYREKNKQNGERTPYEPSTNTIRTPDNSNSNSNKDLNKKIFGEMVYLTDEEHGKLVSEFGASEIELWIDKLNEWLVDNPTKAKKKKSHYLTIRNWIRTAEKNKADRKQHTNKTMPPLALVSGGGNEHLARAYKSQGIDA